jgi:hypothetical protein
MSLVRHDDVLNRELLELEAAYGAFRVQHRWVTADDCLHTSIVAPKCLLKLHGRSIYLELRVRQHVISIEQLVFIPSRRRKMRALFGPIPWPNVVSP